MQTAEYRAEMGNKKCRTRIADLKLWTDDGAQLSVPGYSLTAHHRSLTANIGSLNADR